MSDTDYIDPATVTVISRETYSGTAYLFAVAPARTNDGRCRIVARQDRYGADWESACEGVCTRDEVLLRHARSVQGRPSVIEPLHDSFRAAWTQVEREENERKTAEENAGSMMRENERRRVAYRAKIDAEHGNLKCKKADLSIPVKSRKHALDEGKMETRETKGLVIAKGPGADLFAIHKSVNGYKDSANCWCVTHLRTGLAAIHGASSQRDARIAASRLASCGIDWRQDEIGITKQVRAVKGLGDWAYALRVNPYAVAPFHAAAFEEFWTLNDFMAAQATDATDEASS